jgi:hypothetical protein
MNKRILLFFSDTKTIMCIFLCTSLIGIISLCLFKNLAVNKPLSYNQLLGLRILSFLIYTVIAYFTYKGVKIIRWLMAVIILLTGIHASFLGIFMIDWHQYFFKPYFIVFGLYFIFGGITLFRLKKNEFLTSASRGSV